MPLGIPPGCCYALSFRKQEGDPVYSRAERRHNDFSKAVRKRNIRPDWYDNLHQYSKNKVHCSCCMCSMKTNNKGFKRRHVWFPATNWTITDRKKLDSMQDDYDDYENGGVWIA